MRFLFLTLFLLGSLASLDARAQLKELSPAQQRRANRRALRDAARYPAEYKDSHLAVSKEELKEGNGGRQAATKPTDGRENYQFDRGGDPRVSEPSRVNLRLRKKDKAPTP